MKKNLLKKMFRDLSFNAVQFVSIFIMCFLAMFLLAGFDADTQGRLRSTDRYYKETGLFDLALTSEGFTREDIIELEKLPGIKKAERRTSLIGRVTSCFGRKIELNFLEENEVCKFYVLEGEPFTPGKRGIWIDWHFAKVNNLSVGDSVEIDIDGRGFTEPVIGIVDEPQHTNFMIDDSYAEAMYGDYCYAFLDSSEYPRDNIVFENVLIDVASVDNQMFLTDADRRALAQTKLDVLDNLSKSSLAIMLKYEQDGYASQKSDCSFNETMNRVFPTLFILLALLSTITTMSRITAKQRTVIGTLKALGFNRATITIHYISYTIVISSAGGTLGLVTGYYGLGSWLIEDFADYYSVPGWRMEMSYMVPAVLVFMIIMSTLANYLSCRRLLTLNASMILKPEAPKAGGAGHLEKTLLWKHLSFATRWNLRDININRFRSVMGIFGVFICSSVLMGAFGFDEILNEQEDWIYKDLRPAEYTINLSGDGGYSWAYDYAREYRGQMVMVTNAELISRSDNRLFTVTVADEGNLYRVQNKKREYIRIPKYGAIVSHKAAEVLDIKKGDNVSFRLPTEKKIYVVPVTDICVAPDVQGIIISRNCFEKLGGCFDPKTIYTDMTVPVSYADNRREVSGVLSKKELIRAYLRSSASMNEMVIVIIIIGMIVGFTGMYNTGIMSYIEKTRDVATLKVLGFSTKKIRWILQQQNLLLTGLGTIIGIPVGLWYIDILIDSMDPTADYIVDLSYMPYLKMVLFSFGLSIVVNALISARVKSIDMVEALKGVE